MSVMPFRDEQGDGSPWDVGDDALRTMGPQAEDFPVIEDAPEPVTFVADDDEKCRCPSSEAHTCPYKAEINDDSITLCECCDNCAHECAMDI